MKGIILFLTLLFTINSFADTVCISPKIETITLNTLAAQDKQSIYFGGRYTIKLTPPNKVIFSRDMLIYWYAKDNYITLHADSVMTKSNKNQYLGAFGLIPESTIPQDSLYLRQALNICNGKITQYKIQDMNDIIIAIQNQIGHESNTMVYLFNEVSPFIELVQFTGVSNKIIQTTLSTLEKLKK